MLFEEKIQLRLQAVYTFHGTHDPKTFPLTNSYALEFPLQDTFYKQKHRNHTFVSFFHFIVRARVARAFFIVHVMNMLVFMSMLAENALEKFALW